MDAGPEQIWHASELHHNGDHGEEHELALPTRRSILFPKYGRTVNCKSDLILILRSGFHESYYP